MDQAQGIIVVITRSTIDYVMWVESLYDISFLAVPTTSNMTNTQISQSTAHKEKNKLLIYERETHIYIEHTNLL